MTEMHEVLYPPKESDTRVQHRRYDGKERLIAWSVRQEDYLLLFRVTSFREATLESGKTIDVPESIECRFSETDIDPDFAFTETISYDAFGNQVTSGEKDSSMRDRYVWTGREVDLETGLRYNRARYYDPTPGAEFDVEQASQYNRARCYDPTQGRWITEDALGYDASADDVYPYAAKAPVSETPTDKPEEQK